jgi:hypothetical protein
MPNVRSECASPEYGSHAQSTHENAELAAYIADMAAELATLAGRAQLPMLAYFLNLARVEAQIHARENGARVMESACAD